MLLASVGGKISGSVTSLVDGSGLAGATVRIVGTNLSTSTDEDGEYFLLNVPVGKYDLAVSYIGFESVTKREIRVLVDLTTPVDFDLQAAAIDVQKEQVIYGVDPIIQRDLTASRVIFTADRLSNLPNILSVQRILQRYPGVVADRNNDIHVRGGRSGELTYLYDGYTVMDPFVSNTGVRIIPGSLEELSLTSGGFATEYGNAQSGIVSAVTREGTSAYHGSFRSYEGFTHQYDVSRATWGDLARSDNRSLAVDLSGPIPGLDPERYNFFGAGEYLRAPSSLPHDLAINYTGTMKFSLQPIPKLRLKLVGLANSVDGELYNHRDRNGVSFDFNLDGLPIFESRAHLAGLTANYAVDGRTIVSASVNRFHTRFYSSPKHLFGQHWSQWPGYAEDAAGNYTGTIHLNNYGNNPDYTNPLEAVGFATGDDFDPSYNYREATYHAVAVNATRQLDASNEVETGVEYKRYDVTRDFKQFYNSQPYAELFSSRPKYFTWYVQDKMEYEDFVINLGLRYDYTNADIRYNANPAGQAIEKAADPKSVWSPRLGVSFPISLSTVAHFNYGVFFQTARYNYLYFNLKGDVSSGLPLIGNPDLLPEQTTSYELGLDHLINDGLRIDLTAYYKDLADLVTTREIDTIAGNPVTRYENGDYGSVTGFDFALEKLANGTPLSGSISYSYLTARGTGSDANVPYYSYITSNTDTLAPVGEYPLDFDQRHTVSALVDLRFGSDWKGRLFGLKLPTNWGISLVGTYGSGMPYTKTDRNGRRIGGRNEGRLPASMTVDMRLSKDFFLTSFGSNLTLFVEVDNLFNRRNVINVYSMTGLADYDNSVIQAGGLSLRQEEINAADRLYDHDPQNYSQPRTVRTGLKIGF